MTREEALDEIVRLTNELDEMSWWRIFKAYKMQGQIEKLSKRFNIDTTDL